MQPPGWQRTPAPDTPQDGSAPLEPLVEDGPPAAPDRLSAVQSDRYEDFLRSSVDWLWETDADLMLTYVSSPIAHRLGIPAQALAGRPLGALGRFEADGGPGRQGQAAIEARRPFRNAVFVMSGAEARKVPCHLSGVPFFDARDGRFAGYRGTAVAPPSADGPREDADEDLRVLATTLEQALLRQQELSWRYTRLKETHAPEQVSLARTAHELRTPLNAIVGYADLALNEIFGPLSERYQDCFRTIREAGRHLDQLVAQIHEKDPESDHKGLASEIVEIAAVIAKAKAIVALSAKTSDVDIARVGPMAGGRVVGDRVACTQILVNLLNNAVKFTPPGGSVGLETLAGPENKLQIVVWDTGVGIPEDEQARIFGPSYRAAPDVAVAQAPGLGLGLAISRDLARAMGGDITVSSQSGQGSRFILSLPLAAEPVPSSG